MDDLFNTASDTKDAFEEMTDSKPVTQYKPKKENYWDKTDIQPVEIDVSKFKRKGKSFAIYVHPENDIPSDAADKIITTAKVLMKNGYVLRHTGDGNNVLQNAIINSENSKYVSYLPWKKFNTNIDNPILCKPIGYQVAIGIHKAFTKLPPAVRAILCRDVMALCGEDITDPVDFILTWTEGGAEALTKNVDFKKIGNTTFILQVAKRANIPVFNVYNNDFLDRLKSLVK